MFDTAYRLIFVAIIASHTPIAFAKDPPDPALLEYIGATKRLENSGVDVESLISSRVKNNQPPTINGPVNEKKTLGNPGRLDYS